MRTYLGIILIFCALPILHSCIDINHIYIKNKHRQKEESNSAFGRNGILKFFSKTDLNNISSEEFTATKVLNDGKILSIGGTSANGSPDALVVRLNSDGTPDASFGTNGKVILDINRTSDDHFNDLIIDSAGKYILAGHTISNGSYDGVVVRLNSDGSLDTTFGVNGKVILDIGTSSYDEFLSLALDSVGKIIVGGDSDANGTMHALLVRLNSNGSLDSSFGANGKVLLNIGASDELDELIMDSLDRIVVTGYSSNVGFVARLNPNGSMDSTFGTNGVAWTTSHSYLYSLSFDSNGKIITGGFTPSEDVFIARFNDDGNPDTGFGNNGEVILDIGANSSDFLTKVRVDSIGKIYAIGGSRAAGGGIIEGLILRLNTDGSLDTGFGINGKTLSSFGAGNDARLNSLSFTSQGDVVVCGNNFENYSYDGLIVRYSNSGTLDVNFASSGKYLLDLPTFSHDLFNSLISDSSGKLVAGGYSYSDSQNVALVVRYNRDGTLDSGFGNQGKVLLDVVTNYDDTISSLAMDSAGRIVAIGNSNGGGNYEGFVFRLNGDGSLDTSFGTNGKIIFKAGNATYDYFYALKIDSAGKIVVAGNSQAFGDPDALLLRFNSDGSLDTSFGNSGKVVLDIGTNSDDFLNALAIDTSGKIVVAGNTNTSDALVLRFNPDGTLDNSFGTNGKLILDIANNSYDYLSSLALDSSGKIIVGGNSSANGPYGALVVRLNNNGSLDNSFGINGKVILNVETNSSDYIYALTLDAEGKILAAGNSSTNNNYSALLVRLKEDGSLDRSNNIDPVVTISNAENLAAASLLVDSDHHIFMAGNSGNLVGSFIARLYDNLTYDGTHPIDDNPTP